MNPSLGERFGIRKAPDEDRNFFDAYCIIILAVHIVTANGNPKQKSRKFGTRRNIYKMPQVTCYRLPLYAIRSIRCNWSKDSRIATVHEKFPTIPRLCLYQALPGVPIPIRIYATVSSTVLLHEPLCLILEILTLHKAC